MLKCPIFQDSETNILWAIFSTNKYYCDKNHFGKGSLSIFRKSDIMQGPHFKQSESECHSRPIYWIFDLKKYVSQTDSWKIRITAFKNLDSKATKKTQHKQKAVIFFSQDQHNTYKIKFNCTFKSVSIFVITFKCSQFPVSN